MIRRGFYFFTLLLSFSASAQSYGPIKSKTFYFDVDNFSLTQESMKILRVFIDEVKNTPIEIVEIIGYVEENSAIVYNKIRSKKRIDILKHSLDNSITVYQYKPLNIDYAPAFLYSYEDGYNWRKVDITYRQIIEINPNNKDFINVAQNKITKKDEPFIPLDKNYNSEVNQGKNESYQISDGGKGTTIKAKLEENPVIKVNKSTSEYLQYKNSTKKQENQTGNKVLSENEISEQISKSIEERIKEQLTISQPKEITQTNEKMVEESKSETISSSNNPQEEQVETSPTINSQKSGKTLEESKSKVGDTKENLKDSINVITTNEGINKVTQTKNINEKESSSNNETISSSKNSQEEKIEPSSTIITQITEKMVEESKSEGGETNKNLNDRSVNEKENSTNNETISSSNSTLNEQVRTSSTINSQTSGKTLEESNSKVGDTKEKLKDSSNEITTNEVINKVTQTENINEKESSSNSETINSSNNPQEELVEPSPSINSQTSVKSREESKVGDTKENLKDSINVITTNEVINKVTQTENINEKESSSNNSQEEQAEPSSTINSQTSGKTQEESKNKVGNTKEKLKDSSNEITTNEVINKVTQTENINEKESSSNSETINSSNNPQEEQVETSPTIYSQKSGKTLEESKSKVGDTKEILTDSSNVITTNEDINKVTQTKNINENESSSNNETISLSNNSQEEQGESSTNLDNESSGDIIEESKKEIDNENNLANNLKPGLEENENGEVNIEGRTQDEIDNMVISSPSIKYSKNVPSVDMSKRLSEINVNNLEKSVVLITLNIQFEGNKPITTEVSIKEMKDLFNFLHYNPGVDAFIRGHVCCGDEMALSRRRAKHVYKELIERGISEERLRYKGFSNSLLLVNPERSEADRRMNRRVDIILSKNKNSNTPPKTISQEEFDQSVEKIKTEKKVLQKVPEKSQKESIINFKIFKEPIFKKDRFKNLFKRNE